MPTTFNPKITAAGLAAAVAADLAALDLQITHIALGSGKYDPTGAETALVDRRETATIAPGSSADPASLVAVASFIGYVGADYDLGEVGFFAGDPGAGGVLFAVASRAGLRYAIRSASVETYTPQFVLALSGVPTGSIAVTVDATGNVANSLVANHVAAADPHPQYLKKSGGTMTGSLVLAANATTGLQAVSFQQMRPADGGFTDNDSLTLPSGHILKWGTFTTTLSHETSQTVTFPVAFPNGCLNVQLTPRNPTANVLADAWPDLVSKSASQFVVAAQWPGPNGLSEGLLYGFSWFAIGH